MENGLDWKLLGLKVSVTMVPTSSESANLPSSILNYCSTLEREHLAIQLFPFGKLTGPSPAPLPSLPVSPASAMSRIRPAARHRKTVHLFRVLSRPERSGKRGASQGARRGRTRRRLRKLRSRCIFTQMPQTFPLLLKGNKSSHNHSHGICFDLVLLSVIGAGRAVLSFTLATDIARRMNSEEEVKLTRSSKYPTQDGPRTQIRNLRLDLDDTPSCPAWPAIAADVESELAQLGIQVKSVDGGTVL